jgi:hypothetical protein
MMKKIRPRKRNTEDAALRREEVVFFIKQAS